MQFLLNFKYPLRFCHEIQFINIYFIIKKKEKQNHVSFMFIFCDSSKYIYIYIYI